MADSSLVCLSVRLSKDCGNLSLKEGPAAASALVSDEELPYLLSSVECEVCSPETTLYKTPKSLYFCKVISSLLAHTAS